MGIMDFVKGGVQNMMIARPDNRKDQVVFKHPDQTFPFWSQLTVDSDEVALFFKDGQYMGFLPPGRHTLQTQNIPFLNSLVDRFTGGNVFISEIFFVTTRPQYNKGFGDTIGTMRDPELELVVKPRAFGTFSYRVVDPVTFVKEFIGQTGAADPEQELRWVRDQLFMGLKTTLTRLVKAGEITFMDLGTAGPEVARAIVQDCPDLQRVGVQVLEIAKLNINLNEKDEEEVRKWQRMIVEQKQKNRVAKMSIAEKEADVAKRQMDLDQQFMNQARYVNQLDMGRYQQYAGAQAMMGMGEGMAKGGEGAAVGMAGAGMAAGMGMGAGMMYGAHLGYPPGYPSQGYPPPGYPPQGYPPPGYPPPGYPPQGHYGQPQQGYPQQGYPQQPQHPGQGYAPAAGAAGGAAVVPAPAQAGQATGAADANGAVQCPRCPAKNPPGAKFCAECGTQVA